MKKIIIFLLLTIPLCRCNGQEKGHTKASSKLGNSNFNNKNVDDVINISSIDFFDKKFQKNGYSIPDDINGNLFPSYSYFDRKIGSFSVNYIGKNFKTRDLWKINTKNGYFSKFENSEDGASNSDSIKKMIKESDYYIIADYISAKYINFTNSQDDDLDIKENAINVFYFYENNSWIELERIETKKVPEKRFQYYIKLIQEHNNESMAHWNGRYQVYINADKDWEERCGITVDLKKDSIIFEESGYQTYQIYLLTGMEENNKLQLRYLNKLEGIDSAILDKTKDFGVITYDGKNYLWECPYLDILYTQGKKKTYVLKKSIMK